MCLVPRQVAPAELEGVLLGHTAVADCAVVGVPDQQAGELPRAYVVLKPGERVTEQQIQKYMAGRLKYMWGVCSHNSNYGCADVICSQSNML